MSKRTWDSSLSHERSRQSQVPCSSRHDRHTSSNFPNNKDNMKQWEEARCPVCLEHPHNAVLVICSSYNKGCRPYMCDTSYRHSNCLDQFQKSFAEAPSDAAGHDIPGSSHECKIQDEPPAPNFSGFHKLRHKLTCPLCRGRISGWIVVESSRSFMNGKSRSCAHEACYFSGNYADLRKHARQNHPRVRPSEADPERQRSWRRMERQRDAEDVMSMMQSSIEDYWDGEGVYPRDFELEIQMAVFFLLMS
ncbi:hypothetical protein Droror1_Dr00011558 [Drosera rotundifolia]